MVGEGQGERGKIRCLLYSIFRLLRDLGVGNPC